MLPVTRWFVKAGLISLSVGLAVLFVDACPHIPVQIRLLPVYWHLIAIGWITQVIMGVSIWMFPRDREQRKQLMERNDRGPVRPWVIFWSLNIGLLIRLLAEPFLNPSEPAGPADWIVLLSVILQLTAAILYVAEIWPRIRDRRKSMGGKNPSAERTFPVKNKQSALRPPSPQKERE